MVPSFTDSFQEEISIINPSEQVYNNIIVKFEFLEDYQILPSSFIIEPKEHTILSEYGDFTLDSNYVSFYEDKNVYLKIYSIKAKDKLDYILRFKNNIKDNLNIKVNIIKNEKIEKFDITPFFLYFIKAILTKHCEMEQWPEGLKGQSMRINSCFGGIRVNFSGKEGDTIAYGMWLYPEWSEGEINFIFDTGPDEFKDRISVYRHNNFLITDIIESNSYKHSFKKEVSFLSDWNHIYYSFDINQKKYILYLNNNIIINYTFNKLQFDFPPLHYFGINSQEQYHGNFRLEQLNGWNITFDRNKISLMYNNGKGCFYGDPCFNKI